MQPKVVEITLDSGIRVHVQPLSRYQRNALQEAANAAYPYPDKAPYEVALSEDIAIAGKVVPAEENPDYQKEVARIDALRYEFITEKMFLVCVKYPDFPGGKPDIIEHFADDIAIQRTFMELPEDDWLATWKFAILRSMADEQQIAAIVRDELPLTEKEVNDNVQIFQPALSWAKYRTLAITRQLAPGTQTKVQNQP